jgi:hypothetical protein
LRDVEQHVIIALAGFDVVGRRDAALDRIANVQYNLAHFNSALQ